MFSGFLMLYSSVFFRNMGHLLFQLAWSFVPSALRSSSETGLRLAKDRTSSLGLSDSKRERPQKTVVLRLVKTGYDRS